MAEKGILAWLKDVLSEKKRDEPAEDGRWTEECETHRPGDPRFKDRCVLVGTVRGRRQLETAVRQRFYHIPVSRVSHCSFPVKYVAIYQSRARFGYGSGIRYYAEVKSCRTVPRRQIKEIPKDSDERYLYFKTGRWQALPRAVVADEMEDAAFSTTPYLLKNSHHSYELTVRSEDEQAFCYRLLTTVRELVRRGMPDGETLRYKEHEVRLMNGMVHLFFEDALEYAVGYDVFLSEPMAVVRDIFDYYPEL